eukprot:TRINITY_DN3072_c0_g1_i1.p1 TRINITY_DN3072_c0_g1~~TRINITY_DN3072_c0_g1_i1.p1  ORF type:complete len:443 (-),score=108.98 TRINITY_DN3072_c0_g1_i1:111-1439(-)
MEDEEEEHEEREVEDGLAKMRANWLVQQEAHFLSLMEKREKEEQEYELRIQAAKLRTEIRNIEIASEEAIVNKIKSLKQELSEKIKLKNIHYAQWKASLREGKKLFDLKDWFPGDQILCLNKLRPERINWDFEQNFSMSLLQSLANGNTDYVDNENRSKPPSRVPVPTVPLPTVPQETDPSPCPEEPNMVDIHKKKILKKKPLDTEIDSKASCSESSLSSEDEEYIFTEDKMPSFLEEELQEIEDLIAYIQQLEQERRDRIAEVEKEEKKTETKKTEKVESSPKPVKPKKQNTGAGVKVYFGGICFDDIREQGKSKIPEEERQNVYIEEEGVWTKHKVDQVIQLRIDNYKSIANHFGTVVEFSDSELLSRGYFFATYSSKKAASRAVMMLNRPEVKNEILAQIALHLEKTYTNPLAAPSPSFYVRWPHFYSRIIKREKAKQK